MRGLYLALNFIFVVNAGPLAAAPPASLCDPCVDGAEMHRPVISESSSVSVRQLTPGEVQARAPCLTAKTQTVMTACHGTLATEATSRLGAALSAYRQRLSGEQLDLFDASQAAWVSFRDSACEFQASRAKGGTAYSMVVSQCFEALTNERLRAVDELAACEEGDLSCPAHP